jgi:TPR repeat protein
MLLRRKCTFIVTVLMLTGCDVAIEPRLATAEDARSGEASSKTESVEGQKPAQTGDKLRIEADTGKGKTEDPLLRDADKFVATSFDLNGGPRAFNSLAQQRGDAWKKAADQDDPTGLFLWATCHLMGIGTEHDPNMANALLRRAADNGSPYANVMLGVLAESFTPKVAVDLYRKAAEQKSAWGEYRLGVACSEGRLVPRDEEQAHTLILSAAEHGLAAAQTDIGRRFESAGEAEKAYAWYGKAAAQDDAIGHLNLGACYLFGRGAPISLEMAIAHFKKAAELGDPLAQGYLRAINAASQKTLREPAYDPNDIRTWPSDSQYRELEYQRRENAEFNR